MEGDLGGDLEGRLVLKGVLKRGGEGGMYTSINCLALVIAASCRTWAMTADFGSAESIFVGLFCFVL